MHVMNWTLHHTKQQNKHKNTLNVFWTTVPPTQKHKSSTELVICNLELIVMQPTLSHQKPEAEQQAITHTWASCSHDWSCVISDWSKGPFFWHLKTANTCFFSKVYTTMKFQLVCRKFQLVSTPIPERCDWSIQTHWSEGAHVWSGDCWRF